MTRSTKRRPWPVCSWHLPVSWWTTTRASVADPCPSATASRKSSEARREFDAADASWLPPQLQPPTTRSSQSQQDRKPSLGSKVPIAVGVTVALSMHMPKGHREEYGLTKDRNGKIVGWKANEQEPLHTSSTTHFKFVPDIVYVQFFEKGAPLCLGRSTATLTQRRRRRPRCLRTARGAPADGRPGSKLELCSVVRAACECAE